MAGLPYPPISFPARVSGGTPGSPVVRLAGEHDASSRVAIATTIDRAADSERVEVVVDLSGITFMDASTLGALVGARDRLQRRHLTLILRSPSTYARWLLDLSGVGAALGVPGSTPRAPALGTWVGVPRQPLPTPDQRVVVPTRPKVNTAAVIRGRG